MATTISALPSRGFGAASEGVPTNVIRPVPLNARIKPIHRFRAIRSPSQYQAPIAIQIGRVEVTKPAALAEVYTSPFISARKYKQGSNSDIRSSHFQWVRVIFARCLRPQISNHGNETMAPNHKRKPTACSGEKLCSANLAPTNDELQISIARINAPQAI